MDIILDELRELADGDEAAFRSLVDAYLEASTRLIGDIAAALRGTDAAAARRAAHALKGSAGQFGVMPVMRGALSFEEAATLGDWSKMEAQFAALSAAHTRTSRALRDAKLFE